MAQKQCLFGLTFYTVLTTLALYFRIWDFPKQYHFGCPGSPENYSKAEGRKTILLWTSFFHWDHFTMDEFGTQPFETHCDTDTCFLTKDKCMFSKADAIVFHIFQIRDLPRSRSPHQLYVFFLLESPVNAVTSLRRFDDVFNLTMTYRLDSDIAIPYGHLVRKESREKHGNVELPSLRFPLAERPRDVVWIASNCATQSHREGYVRELKKYIDVDIFGACGRKLPCESGQCLDDFVSAGYKFYLSFENSLCNDYVTEKLFRTLKTEVVPVVYGAANYSEHTRPHSVIDIRDFESPRHLATYLKYLSQNEAEYLKYFTWKKEYLVTTGLIPKAFCQLCNILNAGDYSKTYPSIAEWWTGSACTEPTFKH